MSPVRKYRFLAVILVLIALASGCIPPSTPAPASPALSAPMAQPEASATVPPGGDDQELFVNKEHGYQMYLPKGYEVEQPIPNEIIVLAPQDTAGHRVRAMITVEPAGGRSVEQIVTELKTTALADVADQTATVINLDSEVALFFDRVPSQDLMRMLYTVHEDRLYQMLFMPQDETAGEAYNQMLDVYAAIANTFKFIRIETAQPVRPTGGKLVAEVDVLTRLIEQGFAQRDATALQSMMGAPFAMIDWGQLAEPRWISTAEAVDQMLNNDVPEGAQLAFDPHHPAIAKWFSEMPTWVEGEELIPVHVAGWGAQGADEAVLYIARRANGSLYWQGVITARGGFE